MLGICVYSSATSNSVALLNCNLPLRILERNNLYILLSIRGMLWNIHKITHEEDHLRSSQYPVSRRRTGVSITLTRVLPQTILWIVRWVDWSVSSGKTEQRVSQIGIHRSISWRQTLFGGARIRLEFQPCLLPPGDVRPPRDRGVVFVQRHGVSAACGLVGIKLRVPGIPPVIASRGAAPTIAFLARVTA